MLFPLWVSSEEEPRQRWPWLTSALALGLLLLHIWSHWHLGEGERQALWYRWGAVPFDWHALAPLTCTLLHGDWLHLLGNLLFLLVYGSAVERYLGTWRMGLIWGLGAYASIGLHWWSVGPLQVDEPCIGASGAISALLGAALVRLPTGRLHTIFFSPLTLRPILLELPAWVMLSLWFAGQLLATLQLLGGNAGIAFWAHIGGFVAGALLASIELAWRRWVLGQGQARRHLASAWTAWAQGELGGAQAALQQAGEQRVLGQQGLQALVQGLLTPGAEGAALLVQAARQARDYSQDPALVTATLLLAAQHGVASVPAELVAATALAAQRLRQPSLALLWYRRALAAGATLSVAQQQGLLTLVRRDLGQAKLAGDLVQALAAPAGASGSAPIEPTP